MHMKKFLISIILPITIFTVKPAFAYNEVVEDYLDIATSYAVSGNYKSSIEYLDKILNIDPQNKKILGLKNTIKQMQSGTMPSPMITSNQKLSQAQNAKRNGNKIIRCE